MPRKGSSPKERPTALSPRNRRVQNVCKMHMESFSKRLLHLLRVNRMMFCGPRRYAYHFEKTSVPSKGEAAKRLDHLVVRISRNRRNDAFEESAVSQAELEATLRTGGVRSGLGSGLRSGAKNDPKGGPKRGAHFTASFGPNDESEERRGQEYLLNELNEFVPVDRGGGGVGGTVKCSPQSGDPKGGKHTPPSEDPKGSKHATKRAPPLGSHHDEEAKLERLLKKRQGIKKDIVTITEKARDEIKQLVKEYRSKKDGDPNYILKLFYIIKGCNGLTHSFNFVHKNELHANDELIFEDDGRENILLAIDSKCILYVINTTLDYYRDDLTERFIFTNPNVTSVCPCGTSFHFNRGGGSGGDSGGVSGGVSGGG
ncbi:iron-sulfur assembly protein, putative [Plasmodium vivax]|uniref:Iron-sulfur assembly protein, putative n=1 Tax=Plasmodium vivax TaxID=5855 RepID=A0A1G4GWC3_PLAVI|nr:iron-sulfur assembly protein, putative [Plasmodium vivax]